MRNEDVKHPKWCGGEEGDWKSEEGVKEEGKGERRMDGQTDRQRQRDTEKNRDRERQQ